MENGMSPMKGKDRTASPACVVTGIQNMTEMQNHKSKSQGGVVGIWYGGNRSKTAFGVIVHFHVTKMTTENAKSPAQPGLLSA